MNFLNKHAFTTPDWLLNQEVLSRIEATGAIERVQNLQTRALNNLLDMKRLKRMVSNQQMNGSEAYTAVELMDDLRKGIFRELYSGRVTDAYRRNLQRSYVDASSAYLQKLKGKDNEAVLKSDIIALMRGEMERLKKDLSARKNNVSDSLTRYHWNDLIARIDAGLTVDL